MKVRKIIKMKMKILLLGLKKNLWMILKKNGKNYKKKIIINNNKLIFNFFLYKS